MMSDSNWFQAFTSELQRAEQARMRGNEGQARVCARRAAGVVISEYFLRRGEALAGPSAYNHLRYLADHPSVAPRLREAAGHFLQRTNPDHSFPLPVDLIAEARWLAQQLLDEPEGPIST
jgi:hypothetical protein